MALLTFLLQNRGDILGKGNLSLRRGHVDRRLRSGRRHSRHHDDQHRKNDSNRTKVHRLHRGTSSKSSHAELSIPTLSLCKTLDLPLFSCQAKTTAHTARQFGVGATRLAVGTPQGQSAGRTEQSSISMTRAKERKAEEDVGRLVPFIWLAYIKN